MDTKHLERRLAWGQSSVGVGSHDDHFYDDSEALCGLTVSHCCLPLARLAVQMLPLPDGGGHAKCTPDSAEDFFSL